MHKNGYGFLTTSGILAAILTVLVVSGVAMAQGGTLFIPGSLNARTGTPINGVNSHAEISARCELCHAPFWSATSMSDLCEACHTDIPAQWQNSATLHGILHKADPAATCRTCHPDHRGPNAPVTFLDTSNFPHTGLGFSLAGHKTIADDTPFTCSDCHGQNYITFSQAVCTTCHSLTAPAFTKSHIQDFGSTCLTCHDGVDSYGHKFDHNRVTFKLVGKHSQVVCGQCHPNARTIADLRSAPQDCKSCHAVQDAHQGRLGTDCSSCHTPGGWTPARMDHNLSSYKLVDKHVNVACTACHVNNVYFGTPRACISCHQKDDPHKGQFGGADCGSCHTAAGWSPSTYDHNLSTYKLTGKHAAVACSACHVNNVYRGTPIDCIACHKKNDTHSGLFGPNCANCHSPSGWTPASVNHDLFSFKLTGRHVAVSCAGCHANNIYIGTASTCYACHQKNDNHGGQFGTNCGNCHGTGGWLPASFDHSVYPFKLIGAHVNVGCRGCHANNNYKGTPTACYSCHKGNDTHNGQFGTNCSTCHSTSAWKPASFDHTKFALTGGHAGLSCSQCHTSGVYAGLSQSCSSCHAEPAVHQGQFGTNCASCHNTSNWNATFNHTGFSLTGGHAGLTCAQCHTNGNYSNLSASCSSCHAEPAVHKGQFGTNCASCHSTSNWNATFSHTGFSLTGGHAGLSCTQCHTGGNYSGLSAACASCHAEPAIHKGQFGTNCANCHTTNNWNASFNHPNACGEGGCTNHHGAACADCHTNSSDYSVATCKKCHGSNNPGGG
jgi:hypothetical protein